jgi:hypothetical protein
MFGFIKQAWLLATERAKIHRALRLANKQDWSVEFLTALLVRAAKVYGSALEMDIVGPDNVRLTIRTVDKIETPYKDDDILNNLDDQLKVDQFVEMMQRRRR